MFKLLSLLLLISAPLFSAMIEFPLDEPVMQTSEINYVYDTDDYFYKYHEKLKATLSLKNNSEEAMLIEVGYLSIYGDYFIDDILSFDREIFNSEAPEKGDDLIKSWKQLANQSHLMQVTPYSVVMSIQDSNLFYTHQNNLLLQGYLKTIAYINDKELEVGDSFIVHNWNYKITNITENEIFYTLTIDGSKGQGHGHWNRDNGLCGHLYLKFNPNGWTSWAINLTSKAA